MRAWAEGGGALLLLAAALSATAAALAGWGWKLSTRFEDQIARTARVHAELAARDFSEEVRVQQEGTAEYLIGRLLLAPINDPQVAMRRLREATTATFEDCRCVILPIRGPLFYWTSAAPERLVTTGMSPERAEALRKRLLKIAGPTDLERTDLPMLKADDDGNEILTPIVLSTRGGVITMVGYHSSAEDLAGTLLEPVVYYVHRLRYGTDDTDLLRWALTKPSGDTLFKVGQFNSAEPFFATAFFRPRFRSDADSTTAALLPAGQRDVRTEPFRVYVQSDRQALVRYLYGNLTPPVGPIAALFGLSILLTVATLLLARRFVRHVREREAFATAVAHDLRTPLTQILLYGESMQLGRAGSANAGDASRIIVRETRRLIHLVENALQHVRSDRARPTLDLVAVPLGTHLRETVLGLTPLFERAGMRAELVAPNEIEVVADRDAVAQIVTNLIDNAIRFGHAGQTVRVTLDELDGRARVIVDDEGPGIPPGERESVFRPFVRGARSPGAGIGLAISRQLAELMAGSLVASESPSGGARLILTLPLTEHAT